MKSVLNTVNLLLEDHLGKIHELLKSLKETTNEFQNKEHLEPFNIILATSDIYYRENFHSDIMAYILEKNNKNMEYFINYINGLSNLPIISKENYHIFEVVREENKIDILIKDLNTSHCIIIENKINNAGDMNRQLPRYYSSVKKQGFIVDRIIYYSVDGKKRPDKSTWTNKDLQLKLDDIIVYGSASDGSDMDFVNKFLIPCKNNTNNEQETAFYSQYIDLLEYLRRNQMDYQLMEKFYMEMLKIEQYHSALSLRDMLNELIPFRRDRIYNLLVNNHKPFEKTFKYSSNDTVYEYIRDIDAKERIKIDIESEQDYTKLSFWIQSPNTKSDLIKIILQNIGEEDSFVFEEINNYSKTFKFPEEDEVMYKYITKLFKLLDKNKNTINKK